MIDIIIPTCNSQDTIKRCINSVLKIQDLSYKIILVDDGSNDNTPKINDWYSHRYFNVCSIHQNNKGVSSARNNGLRHAHDKWVCFIDSDDFINSNNFTKVVKTYLSSNVDLIISDINYNGKVMSLTNHNYIYDNTNQFLKYNYPLYGNELIHVVWNKFFNNNIIKKYNIIFPNDIEVGEDLIFVLRYLLHIKKQIVQTNISYYNYYIYGNSVTKSFEKNSINSRAEILNNIIKVYSYYNLSFKAMNNLKLKATYSILLNGLNKSNNVIKYLKSKRNDIIRRKIFNIKLNNNSIKNKILCIFFKQPSIFILYLFLLLINCIRKVIFRLKY